MARKRKASVSEETFDEFLAEHGMLPGDPLRVFGSQGPVGNLHLQEAVVKGVDPTTVKPNEVNPFTGEGL